MRISPKVLLAGAAGVASLAFVGVGAGAAFTSTATVGQSIATGTTGITLTSDGPVNCTSGSSTCVIGTTYGSGSSTLALGSVTNLGSTFSFSETVTLTNSGSLALKTGSLMVADPAVAKGGANAYLAQETMVSFSVPGVAAVSDTLYNLEKSGNGLHFSVPGGSFASGASTTGTVTFSSQSGGLNNHAQGGLVQPLLTITGSDA